MIMAMDPSLTNFGYAIFDIQSKLVTQSVIKTQPETKRTGQYLFYDKQRRLKYIAAHLGEAINTHNPEILVTERFDGGAQSNKSAQALAEMRCLVFMVAHFLNYPLHAVSIYDVKLALTGRKKAKKIDMMKAAVELYPELGRFIAPKLKAGYSPIFEHIADCIGVFEAFKLTEMYTFYLNSHT